jgi:FPC/CPF motif-containing protein YcgG
VTDARAARRQLAADDAFRAFVGAPDYPCLAGTGLVHQRSYELGVYGRLGSDVTAIDLASGLASFLARPPSEQGRFTAYVAVFMDGRAPASERAFERRLWKQLQTLHERDDPAIGWDPTVSPDPDDPHFSFSFAGCALFVIGMHPRSSRLARRFPWPALVFNPHIQFEQLRAEGKFEHLRAAIRDRELALQGSLNPSLADFGQQSDARQYSGRKAEATWRCPFHATHPPPKRGVQNGAPPTSPAAGEESA